MARYAFSYHVGGKCVLYLESAPSEDAMDETEDGTAIDFTGNGYLRFWARCRQAIQDYKSIKTVLGRALNGCHGTLADLYTGDERSM